MSLRYPQFYSFTFKDGTTEHFSADTNGPKSFLDLVLQHGEELDYGKLDTEKEIVAFEVKFTFYKD